MIYGDEPQQIGEYEDPLGTSRYVYAPKVSAIKQAANQYGYGLANPVYYCDRNGKMGEMALQWSAGMWWLTLIDGVLPVGDVIYVVGIGVLSIADAINTFGADNVVSLITDAPNVLSESIRSLSHWVQNIGKGGTVPNPGDPNWGKGFKSFRQLKKFLGSPGKGKEWHHIVEQCQEKSTRAGFSSQQIQNTNNVINISKEVISKYLPSIVECRILCLLILVA
ncbi:MAG: hypothetical protein II453_16625 [Alphaproteobacteria bacterium]|nr:hypothetical protein [Alphaproteobacteria bacterium]